jgi:hypothetical protein
VGSQRAFVASAESGNVIAIDLADPASPEHKSTLSVASDFGFFCEEQDCSYEGMDFGGDGTPCGYADTLRIVANDAAFSCCSGRLGGNQSSKREKPARWRGGGTPRLTGRRARRLVLGHDRGRRDDGFGREVPDALRERRGLQLLVLRGRVPRRGPLRGNQSFTAPSDPLVASPQVDKNGGEVCADDGTRYHECYLKSTYTLAQATTAGEGSVADCVDYAVWEGGAHWNDHSYDENWVGASGPSECGNVVAESVQSVATATVDGYPNGVVVAASPHKFEWANGYLAHAPRVRKTRWTETSEQTQLRGRHVDGALVRRRTPAQVLRREDAQLPWLRRGGHQTRGYHVDGQQGRVHQRGLGA